MPSQLSAISLQSVQQWLKQAKAHFGTVQPFFTDIKFLFGLGLIIFAVYMAITTIPDKLNAYQQAKTQLSQAQQMTQGVKSRNDQLQKIAQDLNNTATLITMIPADKSPQLYSLTIAQKLVEASAAAQAKYIDMQQKTAVPILIDQAIVIPPTLAGILGSANPAASATSAPLAGPTAANAPSSASTTLTPGSLNGFPYHMTVQGTYAHLVAFIGKIAVLPSLIVINTLKLTPAKSDISTTGKPDDVSDLLNLELDFTIPLMTAGPSPAGPSGPVVPHQ